MNEYLAHAGPTIREHGGFIDKYIGDAIMALFEDPDGALRAAVALQETLRTFNDVRLSHGGAPIAIGVGIHAGTLMLGTVGEERRIDTTVIADAVNVASRVEGLTKEYHVGIVVTDDLVKRLKAPPESLRPLGETHVKGLERESSFTHVSLTRHLRSRSPGARHDADSPSTACSIRRTLSNTGGLLQFVGARTLTPGNL